MLYGHLAVKGLIVSSFFNRFSVWFFGYVKQKLYFLVLKTDNRVSEYNEHQVRDTIMNRVKHGLHFDDKPFNE